MCSSGLRGIPEVTVDTTGDGVVTDGETEVADADTDRRSATPTPSGVADPGDVGGDFWEGLKEGDLLKFMALGWEGECSGVSRRNALAGEACRGPSENRGAMGLIALRTADADPIDAAALLSAVEPMDRLESFRCLIKFANSWLTRNTGKRGCSCSSSGSSCSSSGMTVDLKRIRSHLSRT